MARSKQQHFLLRSWYQKSFGMVLLSPLSLLYWLLSSARRRLFRWGLLASYRPAVPVIVVGNISVGGTGKTPLVIALVKALQQAGFKPGIVSRGYGSQAPAYPFAVTAENNPRMSGDEPLLMALHTAVPVVIDSHRGNAVKYLLANNECDVIVSDDGLQHYALQRDIEIVVVDAKRGFGNRLVLPAGPLRETVSRLATVDYLISNGEGLQADIPAGNSHRPLHIMQLQPQALHAVSDATALETDQWPHSRRVHAVAGIGNPQRFFSSLRQLGFTPVEHEFDDHHAYRQEDLQFAEDLPIIMTEKDAVKVRFINALQHCWYLPIEAVVEDGFYTAIVSQLQSISPSLAAVSSLQGKP